MNWRLLTESIIGAAAHNHAAHLEALRRLGTAVPADGQGIGIVYLLLILALKERTNDEVDASSLRRVAHDIYDGWAPLIGRPVDTLQALLLSPFELNSDEEAIVGAELVVQGTAALGILLAEPSLDLVRLRPWVDEWWEVYGAAALEGADVEHKPNTI